MKSSKTSPSIELDISKNGLLSPVVSVVMPVFNQASTIIENLMDLLSAMTVPFEVIVIDDASKDGTLKKLKECLPRLIAATQTLTRLRIYSFRSSVFETACDSFGFSVADGRLLLEIQADMSQFEFAFDAKMIQALDAFDDILMISGRGVERLGPIADLYTQSMGSVGALETSFMGHVLNRVKHQLVYRFNAKTAENANELASIPSKNSPPETGNNLSITLDQAADLIAPGEREFNRTGQAGRLGLLIEVELNEGTISDRRIWLGETVIRGPLLIDRQKFETLGGLDTKRFFLGFDDHDLALRGFNLFGYRCGFVPVDFDSPIEAGTTRKPRSLRSEWEIVRHLIAIRPRWRSSALANFTPTTFGSMGPEMVIRDF